MKLLEIENLADSPDWAELWKRDAHQHPWYLPDQLRVAATHRPSYYYLPPTLRSVEEAGHDESGQLRELVPLSLLAYDEIGPVLGLALSIERIDGVARLSAFGRPLCPIEDHSAGGPRRKSAAKLIYRRLEELRREHATDGYHLRDLLVNGELSSLSDLVLRKGAVARPFFTQLIDLSLSVDELSADLRISLRNLLKKGRPDHAFEIVTSENVTTNHRDLLRRLHYRLHGREFRTSSGWDVLLRCVQAGTAFFLFGRDGGEYVSGAYFPYSSRYCHYSIAANDPARYGSGLSHLLLWRAIEYSRRLGCQYFEVGDRVYPAQHDYVAKKYHTISHFKAAFGSRVAARLDVISHS